MLIELDCDGVLLDTGRMTYCSKYGEGMREKGLTFEHSHYFDFREFPPEIRQQIFASFHDTEVLEGMMWNRGVPVFLTMLSHRIKNTKHEVILRTATPEESHLELKKELLYDMLANLGITNFKVHTLLSSDASKDPHHSDILVEDNAENLIKATAGCKILIDHSYNQEAEYPGLSSIEYKRVPNTEIGWNLAFQYINLALFKD